jgi:hypothetical protein
MQLPKEALSKLDERLVERERLFGSNAFASGFVNSIFVESRMRPWIVVSSITNNAVARDLSLSCGACIVR